VGQSYDERFVLTLPYPCRGLVHDELMKRRAELNAGFRKAVEHDFKTKVLPGTVRDRIFNEAWDEGHSSGYDEVAVYYERYAAIALAAFAAGIKLSKRRKER
jgi:hypothetical protein